MRPISLFLLFAILALGAGCDDVRVYDIAAGSHSANHGVAAQRGSLLRFRATFDDTAIYETRDPSNQADINKLYGFADCSAHHHTNSARFGWRWYDDELQILAYTYVDGDRQWSLLGSAPLNEAVEYRIQLDGDRYVFTFDGQVTEMPRGCDGNGGVKYRLYPYFGGDEEAPHDISITVELL
ncbi:MAG: hypothetical protein ACI9U2_004502 [Bradymonadia bacterium]|jgi:hypothetical protein